MTHQWLNSEAHEYKMQTNGYEGKKGGVHFWGNRAFFTELIFFLFCVEMDWLYIPSQSRSLQGLPRLAPCKVSAAAGLKGSSICFIIYLTRADKFPPHFQERGYYFKTFLYNYTRAQWNFLWTRPDELV